MHPKPYIIIDTNIIGGPGRGLFQLAHALEENGLDYVITTFKYPKQDSSEFVEEAHRQGLCIDRVEQHSKFDLSPLRQLARKVSEGEFNIIQSHGYKSHAAALFLSWKLGLPWIAFSHGWTAENFKVKVYHSLDKVLLRFPAIVVTVSPPLFSVFSKIRGPRHRTELVLNAVDRDALPRTQIPNRVRNEHGIDSCTTVIGCFGRHSFEKGQDILIRAFAAISGRFPQVTLLFVGDGISRQDHERLAHDLGIGRRTIFKSHDTYIGDCYEAIDLLVLPSRSEGLPNVVLEAMSFSVPVVATNVGAVSEVLTSGENGWIVSPNSVEELSEQLVKVLTDASASKLMGEKGARSLEPRFCPRSRAERIIGMYHDVCEIHGERPAVIAENAG